MEQEPQSPLLYSTVKRVVYRVQLAVHLIFIAIAFLGAFTLLTILILHS